MSKIFQIIFYIIYNNVYLKYSVTHYRITEMSNKHKPLYVSNF